MKYSSLLTVRDLDNRKKLGGVGNYYKCLKPYLPNITYQFIGKRYNDNTNIILRLLSDYKSIWNALRIKDLMIINPSLNINCIYRDGISALISKKKNKKLIVFFRGWDPKVEQRAEKSIFLRNWLKHTLLKADHIIVLSSRFKEKLIEWGYKKEITIETTLVDENLLNGFDHKHKNVRINNLLFLSAVSKSKGIMEALDAFYLLKKKNPELTFHIAGAGKATLTVKEKINIQRITGVNLLGYITGKDKAKAFRNADLFLFPSYHEGMPNAVLEAMAFGLPVITTRVGGLPDFFEDGKMGLFLDNHDPAHIAEKIQYLLDRPGMMQQMSEYNYHYAKDRFYASKVAKRLEAIIATVANS